MCFLVRFSESVLACSSSDFGAGSCSGQLCLCAMSSQAVCLAPESLLGGTSSCPSAGFASRPGIVAHLVRTIFPFADDTS